MASSNARRPFSFSRLFSQRSVRSLVFAALAAFVCLFETGCVTGRREMALPILPTATTPTVKGSVGIMSVSDARKFENKPKDPATPSIDGDVNSLSPAEKARFIGRQRNTYGGAMGDAALSGDDTVMKRTEAVIEEGLRQHGYKLVRGAAAAGDNTVSVVIDEFWGWSTPGFATISFEAKMTCRITITRGGTTSTFTVKGQGLNRAQVARDANWQLAYTRCFENFIENLRVELAKAGL